MRVFGIDVIASVLGVQRLGYAEAVSSNWGEEKEIALQLFHDSSEVSTQFLVHSSYDPRISIDEWHFSRPSPKVLNIGKPEIAIISSNPTEQDLIRCLKYLVLFPMLEMSKPLKNYCTHAFKDACATNSESRYSLLAKSLFPLSVSEVEKHA